MADIKFDHIYKRFDRGLPAVTDFNLDISDGEFIVFVGPSGCGKSTMLRMIAGLEEITEGSLYIDDNYINDVSPKDRDIAMVFQNYALYPHMDVFDNMAFGLKIGKFQKAEIKERVENVCQILGLEDYLHRKPKALSGGERQRVALGRAIVRNPKVFLMDEPLSNLDAKLRVQMRYEIIKIHQQLKTTTIYVTHDQTEAMTMASRIVVMKDGFIEQIGAPRQVYHYPENMFVGGFIGAPPMNFLEGTIRDNHFWIDNQVSMKIPEERLSEIKKHEGIAIILGIRPEDVHDEEAFLETMQESKANVTIDLAEITGSEAVLYTKIGNQDITAVVNLRSNIQQGDNLELGFNMNKVHFFDPESGNRLKPAHET
ncbi:sn-glycerol-3-phosphate ABC transporter ATP-binding protein UgpC [Salicibibacter halophilus]|uniref:sn-glycerol-3-phosphate ABC transporter ATP-binding protein UgpC n=1 Tax=Salicibibacter halophilus TaxID=2502791 RepID=A0A514LKZ2_9BACI|nr:sn-glycerol-3-phosphate ABC transporter ATP-binding protein UgpC [Salicibibacter halophilus]QDI92205.1 sn-glycerol-3-phosphate ABC transporter ATP-binding protein UgpC [Salicibibacter halophilus]